MIVTIESVFRCLNVYIYTVFQPTCCTLFSHHRVVAGGNGNLQIKQYAAGSANATALSPVADFHLGATVGQMLRLAARPPRGRTGPEGRPVVMGWVGQVVLGGDGGALSPQTLTIPQAP